MLYLLQEYCLKWDRTMEMLIFFKKRNNIWAEFLLSTYFDNVSVQCGTKWKEVILNELSSKAAIYRYFLENSAKNQSKKLTVFSTDAFLWILRNFSEQPFCRTLLSPCFWWFRLKSGGSNPVNWLSQTRRNLTVEFLDLNFAR